eukprot:4073022-Pyramimonas_sp.AAC.1
MDISIHQHRQRVCRHWRGYRSCLRPLEHLCRWCHLRHCRRRCRRHRVIAHVRASSICPPSSSTHGNERRQRGRHHRCRDRRRRRPAHHEFCQTSC